MMIDETKLTEALLSGLGFKEAALAAGYEGKHPSSYAKGWLLRRPKVERRLKKAGWTRPVRGGNHAARKSAATFTIKPVAYRAKGMDEMLMDNGAACNAPTTVERLRQRRNEIDAAIGQMERAEEAACALLNGAKK